MKIRINILSLLFTLSLLCGCSADESPLDAPQEVLGKEQAQVVFSISVPEVSLPLSNTRAITDDKAIDNLVIWAFDADGGFLYQLTTEDVDNEGNSVIAHRDNTIYALLPKNDTEVTLVLMANLDIKNLPTVEKGTSREDALNGLTFNYSEKYSYIPMSGESAPFIVKEGAKPGTIRLTRALAKVEVNIEDVLDNFTLNAVTVVNTNMQGVVTRLGSIYNTDDRDDVTTVAESSKKWVGYIPEATAIDKEDTRVSLILAGVNKKNNDGKTRYYRLDFIQHKQTSMEVKYDYITSIERNKHYTFKIEYMAPDMGELNFDDAVDKDEPDNFFFNSGLMTINNEEIRDITTDNQYYLGVTSPDITAIMYPNGDKKYYTANMSVITNSPKGWSIEDLPSGVEVSVDQYSPGKVDEKITSVWIYIKDGNYPNNEVTLYVYCGHFRKSVRVSIQK